MRPAADQVQERMSAYWSRYAAEYDQHQTSRLALPGERETWARVWQEALPAGTRDVLDAGTGSGNVALLLATLGYEVTGVDLSEGMLAQARSKLSAHPGHPNHPHSPQPHPHPRPPRSRAHPPQFRPRPPVFRLGDAVAPRFPPASFDAIVSRYLLWTLRDAPAALSRWRALLRPGGVLVAVDGPWFRDGAQLPCGTERERAFAESYDETAFARLPFGRAGLEEIVASWQEAGFKDVRAEPLPEVLELDRAHGVAPGHRPQLQFRLTARRSA